MKKAREKTGRPLPEGLRRPLTTFATALLLAAVALLVAPSLPWLALPACLLPLLPAWVSPLRCRTASKVFAPDPIAPDFDGLADDLAEDLKAASILGTPIEWLLCPVLDGQGTPAPYSIDFDSAKGRIVLIVYGRKTPRKTGALIFRPSLPLPLVIDRQPVRLRLSPSGRKGEVRLCRYPLLPLATPFTILVELWLALLLILHGLDGSPAQDYPRLLVLALLPFLLRPLRFRFSSGADH